MKKESIRTIIREIVFFLKCSKGVNGDCNIIFNQINPIYESFYNPFFEAIKDISEFHFYSIGKNLSFAKRVSIFKIFFTKKKCIIVSADSDTFTRFFKRKKNLRRIQIFHGLSSFGSIWGTNYITNFDALFTVTPFMLRQLNTEYDKLVRLNNVSLYPVGYVKLMQLTPNKLNSQHDKMKIFYGPTYHKEFSSIFKWLEPIMKVTRDLNAELYVKLHPYLLREEDIILSGGKNWINEISLLANKFDVNVNIVPHETSNNKLMKIFSATDLLITDTSGIGYEFVLATNRPIIFLEERIKVPLKLNPNIFKDYPECYYRGVIGPIVNDVSKLKSTIIECLKKESFPKSLQDFKNDFLFDTYGIPKRIREAMLKEKSKLS